MKLKTIINIYRDFNARVFASVLREPRILAKRWRNAHAQYVTCNNGPSRLEFNPDGLEGIDHARAVVYHEMVHQYVEEYLKLDEDDHHGPIFWRNYKLFAPAGIELGECL